MELLGILKNRSLDYRKCQTASDNIGNSSLMGIINNSITANSRPIDTPQVDNTQAATVSGNTQQQDLYTRMTNFINALQTAAGTRGSQSHLGRREVRDAASAYNITDQNFINLARRAYNSAGERQSLYGTQLANQYFTPAMQQRQQAQQAQQQAQLAQQQADLEAAQKRRNDAANIWANQQRTAATNKFADINSVQDFQSRYNDYARKNNLNTIATDNHFGKDTQNAYTAFYNSLTDPFEREAFRSKMQGLKAQAWASTKNKNNAHNLGSIDYGQEVSNDDINTYANKQTWDDKTVNDLLNNNKNQVIINPVQQNKQGGSLKMRINYFQAGGAVAPQTTQQSEGQDIQAQVIQLVQAAMQGDEKATQTVQQIMEAAKQGDEQATQIAQLIQAVVQQMQGQAQAAKRGAKLSYLHSLKTGCPEGYSVSYNKKGGHLCKECIKQDAEGSKVTTKPTGYLANRKDLSNREKLTHFNQSHPYEDRSVDLTSSERKTQDSLYVKAKKEEAVKKPAKKAKGGNLKRKLCAGKKLAEGDKIDTKKQKPTGFLADRKDLTNAQKLQRFNQKYPNVSSSVDLTPAQRKTEDSLLVKAKKDGSLERMQKQRK